MNSKIKGLGQLAITVSDVSAALEFYRDKLGLEFLFAPADNLAFLQCGETRLMLSTQQGSGEVGKNSIPYFSVQAIETFFSELPQEVIREREPQMAAQMPDHELWMGFVKDPDGNTIASLSCVNQSHLVFERHANQIHLSRRISGQKYRLGSSHS